MAAVRPTPPIRRARPADAAVLADLVDQAGEGLASYLWAQMAEPGSGVCGAGPLRLTNSRARSARSVGNPKRDH